MPQDQTEARGSVVTTLAWVAVLGVAVLWAFDGNFNSLRDRLRKTEGDSKDKPPGPGFVTGPQNGEAIAAPPLPPRRSAAKRKKYRGRKIEDPCLQQKDGACAKRSLDPFYAQLHKLENKQPGTLVRIAHVGDSVVAAGQVTTRARHRFQQNFGDGGPGFLFIREPNRYYHARAANHRSSGWQIRSIGGKSTRDRLFGYGGSSFEGFGRGPKAKFGTMRKGKFGKKVSRYELYYLKQPKGGTAELELDGQVVATIDSASDKRQAAFHNLKCDDDKHDLQLKVTKGRFRAFGMVMERDSGVVYENLGVVGAWVHAFTRINKPHWTAQYAKRSPNLVVFFMGSNEADYLRRGRRSMAAHQKTYEDVIAPIRAGKPGAACIVMAPMDNAVMKDGKLTSLRVIPHMVKAQRKAALAQGCAFWNTFAWMGGYGSARSWRRRGLFWADYEHPTPRGGAKIADALFEAVMAGYDEYKERTNK